MTRFSPRLPEGDANGLGVIARDLVFHPGTKHVLVVIADCAKITTDTDTGDQEATVRIRRVEVLTDRTDARAVATALRRAYERRTGQTVLPLEMEDELTKLLDEMEADTLDVDAGGDE